MSEKLLPCPFCGAPADPPELYGESKTAMFVDCSKCGANVYHGTADKEANSAAVVVAWNRRASLPRPTAGSTGTDDSFISEALAWAENMRLAAVAGCNCGAKTHELSWHSVTCRFRVLEEGAALLEEAASTPAQSVLEKRWMKLWVAMTEIRDLEGGDDILTDEEAIKEALRISNEALDEDASAPSQPAPVVIPRAIDLPDAAREVMARYERSYHGSEVFPTLRMWDEVANVLTSSNRPQATEEGK